MTRLVVSIFVFLIFFLVGCTIDKDTLIVPEVEQKNEKETNLSEQKSNSKEIRIPPELKNVDLVTKGKYRGENLSKQGVEDKLDHFTQNLSEEAYFNKLLSLFAQDYHYYIQTLENFNTDVIAGGDMPNHSGKMPNLPKNKEVNISILLDSSGSMLGEINGETKMILAKRAIQNFISKLPDNSNVSLRVYGHRGSNKAKDKKVSCQSSELVYPLSKYDQDAFEQSLNKFQPTGYTPLALAIKQTHDDLVDHTGKNVQNLTYIVSDGIETCGGNPIQAAKMLHQSNIEAIVNIIGFDINGDSGQKALKRVAEAGQGTFTSVNGKVDLEEYFEYESNRLYDEWQKWRDTNWDKSEKIGDDKSDFIYIAKKEFKDKIQLEYDQLTDAYYYLLNKKYVSMSFHRFIIYRKNILERYVIDKYNELYSKILHNKINTQNYIINKKLQEQEKVLQNKH
ncbi:VWA domain-containing protein [Shimazuella kribbensis]|uniref:VWA domain-containing protein n=1 Tax=Shimazuella kribbensis TaxID=139808 RepID=UPI0003FCB975|nr:VWA domain-containing protein [Shimazuella kribbensis]